MISCSDVKALLWDYYDGECTPVDREAVAGHLAHCRDCQSRLDEWVALSHQAFSQKNVQAPPFLWTRVLAGIEAQEQKQGVPWWVQWRWMSRVTSVASVVVSLGALYLYQNATPSLESLLQGRSAQQRAIQLATSSVDSRDQAAVLAVEGEQ